MSDPTALAGLRRLVLHSRDLLAPHADPVATGAAAKYSEAVNAHAATVLAVQVLSLVADCLADDAAETHPPFE